MEFLKRWALTVCMSRSKASEAQKGIWCFNRRQYRSCANNFDYFINDYFLNAIINGEEDINYLNTLQRYNKNSRDFEIHPGWSNKVRFYSVLIIIEEYMFI